jgi:hypothetical protein
MFERSSIMKMRETLQTLSKKAIGVTLAAGLALPVFAAPQQAQANHRWVGPAIAGLIIGGIIADQVYRHHHRKYVYGYPRVYAYPYVYPQVYGYPYVHQHPRYKKYPRVMQYGYQDQYRSPY